MGTKIKENDKRLNNQFWKLRAKHGRDKLFKDPQLLWETACEYFQWCDEHPWYKNEQVKQQAKPFKNDDGKVEWPSQIASIPTQRPYTLSGLCLYLGCDEMTLRAYGKDEDKKDFFVVVHAIQKTVETQQFEGASVGVFNPSIIAQKLGLVNKVGIEGKDGERLVFEITMKKSNQDAESTD
jgi:hypothetical protein